jgi:excisionase family DNA binding protein
MAILSTEEVMKKFKIGSFSTILMLFREKNSPAFRAGKNWRVDEDDFKKFLQERSAQYKG